MEHDHKIVINQIAREIASKTGQDYHNVHISISRLKKKSGIETLNELNYRIEENKLTELQLNNHTYKRGKSNQWVQS